MKQIFMKQEGNPCLLIFFAGWGSDEHLFDIPSADDCDFMLCYDYTTPDFESSALAYYDSVRLLGWSMGVWAAGEALSSLTLPWEKKIAVNGTPFPISDEKGIPQVVFQGTLDGLSLDTLVKFRRRMCGSSQEVQAFMQRLPQRSLESLREELSALQKRITERGGMAYPLEWDEAVIGTKDRIFPAENQERAWDGLAHIQKKEMAHYDAACLAGLIGEDSEWIKSW